MKIQAQSDKKSGRVSFNFGCMLQFHIFFFTPATYVCIQFSAGKK